MANSVFDLSNLNGANGFILNGITPGDRSGFSVSGAGDINGDGFDDVIIGAYRALSDFGQSYVVFGSSSGFSPTLDLSTLNGTNGFAINGIAASDQSGRVVSNAGDVNGDGFDDVIIGAFAADPNGSLSGQSYVVFGSSSGFSPTFDLSTLNGTNGFTINGIATFNLLGGSVSSAGDINGDGIDDLIIGAYGVGSFSGQSYVVFGSSSGFSPTLNPSTLNGTNGFTINGIAANNQLGKSVSSAGDVNGDGIDDLIIGAPGSVQSYVVFGSSSGFSSTLNLSTLNGTNGFTINGIAGSQSGNSVSSAGDVNGDGFDDLIIGAFTATPNGSLSGQSYVVFGSNSGFSPTLNLSTLNGTNGFTINGIAAGNRSGFSVSNAGDVNGDGFDDVIIGAFGAGQSYVVFGSNSGFSPTLNLSTLNGTNGFALNGTGFAGRSVSSAGDVNGDNIDDLIIGADLSGQSYVVFGNRAPGLDLNGSNGLGINFSSTFTSTPVSIVDNDFTLTDNNATLAGATITITNLLDGTSESLAASAIGNITASYNATTGTLTLSGTDTVANYQQVLASLTYNNTASSHNTTNRTIEFVVDDGQAFSNTSTVATTTLAFNQAPIAVNDVLSTGEDTILNGNVLIANPTTADSDPNNDTLTVTQVNGNAANVGNQITLTSGAILTVNSSGTFVYNPNGRFESLPVGATATNSFNYTISDGNGGTDTATVTVTISGVNDAAIITGTATAAVTEDTSTPNLNVGGFLRVSDADAGEQSFKTTVTSATGNLGSLSISNIGGVAYTLGSYRYTVANSAVQFLGAGQTKTETFTVQSRDGSATQDIVVTINGVNDVATITGTATAAVTEDATTPNLTATGSLAVSDVDADQNIFNTTVTSATGNLGSLSITSAGAYSYSVANSAVQFLGAGQTKAETFTVSSVDGTATQNIVVTINGVNDAPTGSPTATLSNTPEDTAITITAANLLAGFTDVDTSNTLSVTNLTATNGALVNNNNGTYTFTPTANFNGGVNLTYNVTDGTATLTGQTRTFTVTPVNDAPVAVDDSASANKNTPVTLLSADLLANDTDIDGGILSITAVNNGVNGTVSLNGSGNVVFTPTTNFSGNGSFNYTVSDGNGGSDIGLVTVAVGTNLNGTNNNDLLNGTPGNDIINGGNSQDTLYGNGGNDSLIGDNGDDLLYGGDGKDTLNGGNSQDTLYGDAGNDSLFGDNGDDKLYGGDGNDTLNGGEGQDTLTGDAGDDSLVGGNSDDKLYGGDANDSLLGGNGNDLLVGGAGNDFLKGDLGDDNLTGGTGSDIFVLAAATGRDTFTDFSLGQSDKIGLAGGLTFNQLTFSGNEIRQNNQTLAVLTGFNATTLTQNDFISV
ncbi:beta strand repeat-containing protein [Nostoc sp.]|uniref:beta strand repeat-containing protein n=1 Tax=Nostoc sp. TaxID=1180 RepID=UPI002FF71F3E